MTTSSPAEPTPLSTTVIPEGVKLAGLESQDSVSSISTLVNEETIAVEGQDKKDLLTEQQTATVENVDTLPEDDGDEEYEELLAEEEEASLSLKPQAATLIMDNEDLANDDGDAEEDQDEDDELIQESILERIAALADIIPPHVRASVSRSAIRTFRQVRSTAITVGTGAWVLATASFLLLLPAAFELEREHFVLQQENQSRMQQQQMQQVQEQVQAS